mgnify:CR=1 FL=1
MRQRNETITWKVIEESHADVEKDATDLGVQGMNLYEYSRGEVFGKLFLSLTFPRELGYFLSQSFLFVLGLLLVLQNME